MSCGPVVAFRLKITSGTGEPSPGSNMRFRVRRLCNKLGRNTGPLNQRTQDWESDDERGAD